MGNTNGDQSGQHSSQGYIVGTGDRCVHSERPRSRKERNRGRWTQCNIQTTPLPSQTVRFFGSGKGFFFFFCPGPFTTRHRRQRRRSGVTRALPGSAVGQLLEFAGGAQELSQ